MVKAITGVPAWDCSLVPIDPCLFCSWLCVDEPADGLWSVGSQGPISGECQIPNGSPTEGDRRQRSGERVAGLPGGQGGVGGSAPTGGGRLGRQHGQRRWVVACAEHRNAAAPAAPAAPAVAARRPRPPPTPARRRPPMSGATPGPRPRRIRARPTAAARVSITPPPPDASPPPADMMTVAPPDTGPNAMLPPAARRPVRGRRSPRAAAAVPACRGEYFDNDDFTASKFIAPGPAHRLRLGGHAARSLDGEGHVLGSLGREDPPPLHRELHLRRRGQRQRPPLGGRPPAAERVRQQRASHHRGHASNSPRTRPRTS